MPTVLVLDVSLSMSRTVKSGSANSKPDGEVSNGDDLLEIRQLANIGIGSILDYFAQKAQLEYAALLVFSRLWEVKHDFTRNFEKIKDKLYDLEIYSRTNIGAAIMGLGEMKLEEWAQNGPLNIIMVTDGQLRGETESLITEADNNIRIEDGISECFKDWELHKLDDYFEHPCKIQIVCLSSPRDPVLKYSLPILKKVVSRVDKSMKVADCPVIIGPNAKGCKQSAIWLPESESLDIPLKSVEDLFSCLIDVHYKPYHTSLSCGNLSSLIMLSPSPTDYVSKPLKNEFDHLNNEKNSNEAAGSREIFVSATNKSRLYKLAKEMDICGFMPVSEIASPAVTSRHLIMPVQDKRFDETSRAEQILSQDPLTHGKKTQISTNEERVLDTSPKSLKVAKTKVSDANPNKRLAIEETNSDIDQAKQPSFCVLLHNSLKQENMVAICLIGKSEDGQDDWFGMIHPNTDSKKHSSLMLSLLHPGSNPVPWLPSFRTMGSVQLNADLPQSIKDKIESSSKGAVKSYSSNSVIWLDPESVQMDVQKIIRHAKRSPDRAPHFYKELNRIRRAAISYGFYDVLFGLSAILEREKRMLLADQSRTASAETLSQIDHVITCLKGNLDENSYQATIGPNT